MASLESKGTAASRRSIPDRWATDRISAISASGVRPRAPAGPPSKRNWVALSASLESVSFIKGLTSPHHYDLRDRTAEALRNRNQDAVSEGAGPYRFCPDIPGATAREAAAATFTTGISRIRADQPERPRSCSLWRANMTSRSSSGMG